MIGIGILIIFISIILVAAVAATVVIVSASSLQNKGVATGRQAEEGVTAGMEVVTIMASDGSEGNDFEHFEMFLRLQPGSGRINLNNTIILIDTSTTSQQMSFGSVSAEMPSGTDTYNIEYLKRGPDYDEGYISRGDTLKFRFNDYRISSPTATTGGVPENEPIRIKIIPRVGSAALAELKTPDYITVERMTVWP